MNVSNTKFETYKFNSDGIKKIKNNIDKGQKWPVVYIL